jgi:hypothetical protein
LIRARGALTTQSGTQSAHGLFEQEGIFFTQSYVYPNGVEDIIRLISAPALNRPKRRSNNGGFKRGGILSESAKEYSINNRQVWMEINFASPYGRFAHDNKALQQSPT